MANKVVKRAMRGEPDEAVARRDVAELVANGDPHDRTSENKEKLRGKAAPAKTGG